MRSIFFIDVAVVVFVVVVVNINFRSFVIYMDNMATTSESLISYCFLAGSCLSRTNKLLLNIQKTKSILESCHKLLSATNTLH